MEESNNNLKEHPDLYKRSIKGGYWVFGIRLLTQLFGFAKSVIVFNILFEANLELIFVANLFMAALTTFSESGFNAALVQKKEDIESYLDTAWVTGIVRGIILFIIIYFVAPLFASYKAEPEQVTLAVSVIRAMGVCFIIRAFHNIGIVYFQKELQFHKTFWLTMAGTITDIVLSISLLLIYRNVWAVVAARLISEFVNFALSYLLCSYRPRFHFVSQKAQELWRFGKWLFGGKILGYLLNEGDDWFVLFFFPDPLPFKLYRGAYRFANMPATHVTDTISQVSFPAYSKIQHDLPRLRNAYLKVLQLTALISVPIAFMIFSLGPDFVQLFLVEKSHAMIPIIQILAFKGLLKSIGATRGALFQAMGKPHASFHFKWIRLGILSISIYPLTKYYGIAGTAAATLLFSVITNPFGFRLACKLLKCTHWKMLSQLLLPLIAACSVTLGFMYFKNIFTFEVTRISFFGLVLFLGIGYIILLLVLDSIFKTGAKDVIAGHIKPIQQKLIKKN